MTEIVLIAHNIRSTHNVGSIFRTADGLGVRKIILTGYTPYPKHAGDTRLPHIAEKLNSQIHKTALGAEVVVEFEYFDKPPIDQLRADGYKIVALEQSAHSHGLVGYQPADKIALIIGEEVHGIPAGLMEMCDESIEIPMSGQKESFNVSVATAIALYEIVTSPQRSLRRLS